LTAGAAGALPADFRLGQNFPNPFNPDTSIPVHAGIRGGSLRLEIYNTAVQRIRTLLEDVLPAGQSEVSWDGQDDAGRAVSSGTYIYHASTSDGVFSRRMTLLR